MENFTHCKTGKRKRRRSRIPKSGFWPAIVRAVSEELRRSLLWRVSFPEMRSRASRSNHRLLGRLKQGNLHRLRRRLKRSNLRRRWSP